MSEEKRTAYLLTTDENSERANFSKTLLEKIGFEVELVKAIPHEDKVLSNKISMQYIYSKIEKYSYVFEDDINVHEEITLEEIKEYEKYSPKFFYLGMCEYNSKNSEETEIKIRNKKVYKKTGNVRGLHGIGVSKEGAKELLERSKETTERYMDVILEEYSEKNPANIVRYDLESYITGHKGIIYQDRKRFPSDIN